MAKLIMLRPFWILLSGGSNRVDWERNNWPGAADASGWRKLYPDHSKGLRKGLRRSGKLLRVSHSFAFCMDTNAFICLGQYQSFFLVVFLLIDVCLFALAETWRRLWGAEKNSLPRFSNDLLRKNVHFCAQNFWRPFLVIDYILSVI